MKLSIGDTIRVTAGKDKGKTGTIDQIFPFKAKVVVKGVNLYKRHLKKREGFEGGVITKERPLHASSVAVTCPTCHQVTRVGYRLPPQGKKERICKKCQASLKVQIKETKTKTK